MDCLCLRLRGVMLWIFVGITADRAISSNFVGCKLISPIVPGGRISKNALVRLKLQENGYPIQPKPLTIRLSYTGYPVF